MRAIDASRIEEPHPGAQPLATFLDRQRLVVGADACGRVCLELRAEDPGRMAVDVVGPFEAELLELGGRAGDDAGEVHHLARARAPAAGA